jgi:hypothetical protein
MAQNSFNRYEKKFIVTKAQADLLKVDMRPFIEPDAYSSNSYYTICNVYYDTVEDEIIKKSVSKPAFKEKLRLRCYGSSSPDDIVYLEIKKKLNGFVNKRRTHITIAEANQLIFKKVMPLRKKYHNTQVLNEIYHYVLHKELVPRISISYDREAFFAKDDALLRITFDFNITSRRNRVHIGRDIFDEHILDDDLMILEIKTTFAFPLWLTQILSKHHIYSQSFSKYGSEFYDHLIQNRKVDPSCSNPYLTFQAHPSH